MFSKQIVRHMKSETTVAPEMPKEEVVGDLMDEQSASDEDGYIAKPNPYSKKASYVLDDEIYIDISWEPEVDEIAF